MSEKSRAKQRQEKEAWAEIAKQRMGVFSKILTEPYGWFGTLGYSPNGKMLTGASVFTLDPADPKGEKIDKSNTAERSTGIAFVEKTMNSLNEGGMWTSDCGCWQKNGNTITMLTGDPKDTNTALTASILIGLGYEVAGFGVAKA